MDATQPRPARGHDIPQEPDDLKLQPRGAFTWPKAQESSLPDDLPSKGKISKVWRSLRQKSTLMSVNHTGNHPSNGDATSVGEADWSKMKREYPESVLSRATGTTLVGDDESVVSHEVSVTFPTSATVSTTSLSNAASDSLQQSVGNETMPAANVSGADFNASLPNEPALGLPRHWTFPGPSIPLRPRVSREDEDFDDSMSASSRDTVMIGQGANPGDSHRHLSARELYQREGNIILPSVFLRPEIIGDCQSDSRHGEGDISPETFTFQRLVGGPTDLWASTTGLLRKAKQVMASGSDFLFDPSFHDAFGNTLIHGLAAWSDPNAFMLLLEKVGASNASNSGGETFLHSLSESWYKGDSELLFRLVQTLSFEGFRTMAQNVYGQTIAHLVCRKIKDHGKLSRILQILDSSTLLKRDAFGLKPQELMDQEQNLNSDLDNTKPSFNGSFPEAGADAIWRLDAAAPAPETFLSNVSNYDLNLTRFIRRTLKDPQREDDYGRNGLHSTAASTYARLKYLSSGIPEVSASSRTRTWIHRALDDRRGDLVKATLSKAETYAFDLIEVGADVNSYNSFGNTVLMDFVAFVPEDTDHSQDNPILQFLIDAGARLEARNRRGETALLVAARCGRRAAMSTLLRAGARVEVADLWGKDALTILRNRLAHREPGADSYANFQGCLAELSSYSNKLASGISPVREWSLPHRECVELGSKPAMGTKPKRDELVVGGNSDNAFSTEYHHSLAGDMMQHDSEKRTFSRSSTHSTMDIDATTIRSTITSSSSDSYSQEMNSLTDEMCGMILSHAFGSSMNEVSSPREAWESVRRCLDELSVLHHDGLEFDDGEGWDTNTEEMKDDDAEPRHISESRSSSFPSPQSSRKRGHHALRNDEDPEGGEDSDSHDGSGRRNINGQNGSTHGTKRSKTTKLSCPFRKRNPVRYNIRKHFICATSSFQNFSLVKRHVITHHKRQTSRREQIYICTRCQEPFDTVVARDAHLRVPPDQICPLRDAVSNQDTIDDPEDGITAEVENKLRDRKLKSGVNTWDALWATLFPEDQIPKSEDFEPIIEIHEVREAFEGNAHECASALQTVSSGMVLDTTRVSPEGLGRILGRLYQSFVHNTLQGCKDVLTNPAAAIPRRQVTLAREIAELSGVVVGDLRFVLPKNVGYTQSNPIEQSSVRTSRTPRATSVEMISLSDTKSTEDVDRGRLNSLSEQRSLHGQETLGSSSLLNSFFDAPGPGGLGGDCFLCGRHSMSCNCLQDLSTESGLATINDAILFEGGGFNSY